MAEPNDDAVETILPLHEEVIDIARVRTSSVVRVNVINHERTDHIAAELHHEHVEITRVPVGRIVTHAPAVREEDGVTIVPVMEEVLVTERRLMLKEEVHIRRTRTMRTHAESVVLRTQDVVVEREPSREEHDDQHANPHADAIARQTKP